MKKIVLKITPTFEKKAKKLLTSNVLEELYDYLIDHPTKGDLIPGTGGIRKLRWRTGKNDKGKSGGVGVLYIYAHGMLVLLVTVYSKSEQENISQQERNELKRLVPSLINKYMEELL